MRSKHAILNKNTLLSQSAYAWLGIQSVNQTFEEELDFDPTEIEMIYDDQEEDA